MFRGLFLSNDKVLKKALERNKFHLSIINTPSILFKSRQNYKILKIPFSALNMIIKLIKKSILLGVFKDIENQLLLKRIGVSSVFVSNLNLIFSNSSNLTYYDIPKSVNKSEKFIIYTTITGDYDQIINPLFISNAKYVLFTNNKSLVSDFWNVKYVDSELSDLMLSREIKILPHKYLESKYNISIYVDANFLIYGDLADFTSFLNEQTSFVFTSHSERNNIYDEILKNVEIKNISYESAMNQYQRYISEGFDDDLGLGECGILIRRHNDDELINLMNLWWSEFVNGVHRDQISLMYCIWKTQFKNYLKIQGNIWENQYFRILPHK